jgi:hypothetical protein
MLEINAALGGPWEKIGAAIKAAGEEDGSGQRRWVAERLARKDYEALQKFLRVSREEAEAIRAACAAEWGEPEL